MLHTATLACLLAPATAQLLAMSSPKSTLTAKVAFSPNLPAAGGARTAFEAAFKTALASTMNTKAPCSTVQTTADNQGAHASMWTLAPSVASGGLALASLPAGVIGYWPLDGCVLARCGGATTAEAAAAYEGCRCTVADMCHEDRATCQYTIDGALHDAMTNRATNQAWMPGYIGNAFYMNGDDSISVLDKDGSPLDATKVMMMAWVHPDNTDVDESHGVLVAKQNQIDSPDWMMGLTDTNLELQGRFSPCSTWSGTAALEVNRWAHVAVGVDGAQQKNYVGGVRMDTRACAWPATGDTRPATCVDGQACGDLRLNNDQLRIGSTSGDHTHSWQGHSQFKGYIDEVIVFGDAVDDAGVTTIFDAYAALLIGDLAGNVNTAAAAATSVPPPPPTSSGRRLQAATCEEFTEAKVTVTDYASASALGFSIKLADTAADHLETGYTATKTDVGALSVVAGGTTYTASALTDGVVTNNAGTVLYTNVVADPVASNPVADRASGAAAAGPAAALFLAAAGLLL